MARPILRNPVGTHVKVGPGLVKGTLKGARELGLEALQVFTGNPRRWALSEGKPAEGVVVHTGPYVDATGATGLHEAALTKVREGLLPILEVLEDDAMPWLLLEPTAGQGRSLCAGIEDLAPYLAALDHHPKAGICLDTCHAFAAGAPLDEEGGTTATLDRIVELAGPGRLRLVHANDSMDPRGSMRDRHQRLGEGHIGVGCFQELLAHPATDGVPFILETPGSRDPGSDQIALIKELRA